jgi:membrane-bound lytic murein transglycosylase D
MTKHIAILAVLLIAGLRTAFGAPSGPDVQFPQPKAIAPAVAFWTRVYTEMDSNAGFVHDARRLDLIYQTLHLDPNASPSAQDKIIRAALGRYREALTRLSKGKRKGLTDEEAQVLRVWGKGKTPSRLAAASKRLRFQRGQADRFRAGIVRSAAWEREIEDILGDAGLPTDLAALPFVESSYDPLVRSHAGAAGLWQFMRPTGRRYLRIDHVVDERLDPLRSSEAAARLLQHNHTVLKSWPLAITAYNHGLAGMRRAVRDTGSSNIGEIVRRYRGPRFGFASRNFYAAFLAARRIREHPARYFGEISGDAPPRHPILVTNAFYAADALAQALGMTMSDFQGLNPTLQAAVWRGDKLVPQGFEIRLPEGYPPSDAVERLQRLASVEAYAGQKPDRRHRVRRGDSLSVIAARYRTSVKDLMAMNRLRSRHRIRAGQTLQVPGGSEPPRLAEPPPLATVIAVAEQRPDEATTLASAADRGPVLEEVVTLADGGEDPYPLDPGRGELLAAAQSLASPEDPADDAPMPMTLALAQLVPTEPTQAAAAESQTMPDDGPDTEATPDAGVAAADPASQTMPVEPQPALSADPADYQVGAEGDIEIQAAETLGHYAEWLDLRAAELRRINGMRFGQPLVIGRRLKLDFAKVSREDFEQRRLAYHQSLQALYFSRYHIAGVKEHQVRNGDSLWVLATRDYSIPVWLLRQYNPDIDFDTLLPPGSTLSVPLVRLADQSGYDTLEERPPWV